MLNNYLELICKNHRHCYFLRSNINTCYKINILIDSIDYNEKYLNFIQEKKDQSISPELTIHLGRPITKIKFKINTVLHGNSNPVNNKTFFRYKK